MATIRNPIEWGAEQLKHAAQQVQTAGHAIQGSEARPLTARPDVNHIDLTDLRAVLVQGFNDFMAYRTDVIFLCVIYPIAGLVLARFAFDYDLLPLLFPIVSGFALLGPVAAIGLYELSRRRELGLSASWADAFGMIRAPSFGAILALGFILLAVFLLWVGVAQAIYMLTLGPEAPVSASAFLSDVFNTAAGWTMILVGMAVGFLFAVLVLAISVVSFPLLLDRDAGLGIAIGTSVRAVLANPVPMAAWGVIVAAGLALASLPLFLGLIFVMPVLGHATWHLYRKVVPR